MEVGVRDVARLDREALARSPRQVKVQQFDVAGWRVRSYTRGFLQISAADKSTFEQTGDMRAIFGPSVLVFVDFDPLEWNRLVSLRQQLFQFGSRYWIHSVELLSLGPLSLAGLRQTCMNWSEASMRMFLELLPPFFGRYL